MKQHRLFKRENGYYYHRVRVPADIRERYGKAVEQVSLATTDFRTARKLLPSITVKLIKFLMISGVGCKPIVAHVPEPF